MIVIVGAPDGTEAVGTPAGSGAEGVALTRELCREPPNIIYPGKLRRTPADLTDLGVELTVLGEERMRALGMGALLGVAQGSAREAQLLVMQVGRDGGAGRAASRWSARA